MNGERQQNGPRSCLVQFGADGPRVKARRGATILQAARESGVFIDSLCGGDGVCGKCRVIVREGKVEGGLSGLLSREEIQARYVLACEAQIDGDLVLEIPPESSLHKASLETTPHDSRVGDGALPERQSSSLRPLVRKIALTVPAPTLENNAADLERLQHALRGVVGERAEFEIGLDVLRALPEALRQEESQVTATIGWRGNAAEILDVTAGHGAAPNLAVAVDVGTTTIIAQLLDLSTGEALGAAMRYNAQAAYGADVIRRIVWCDTHPDGLAKLHEILATDINALIGELEEKSGSSANDVQAVVAAGNTTMMHLLLGISPRWIRREPYAGAAHVPPPVRAAEAGLAIHPRGLLYCLPSVGAFVGADITAGVMAVGLGESDAVRMLIDIGTNGEIVIGNKDWLVAASASAGPAFEGAGNKNGMRATFGAIDHVHRADRLGELRYSTVGGRPPAGLCGTAYVDLLAELLRMGAIDKTGKFHVDAGSDRLREGPEGTPEFALVRAGENGAKGDVAITQDDVANLLRSKAAIYAAAKVLLRAIGLKFSSVQEILVAGAFGNYLDLGNAVFIGLLPDVAPEKLRFVGNTSVAGAKMAALSAERHEQARRIARGMTYFELSTDPTFMDEFTSACFFPHTHIEEFPSVRELRI